MSFSPDYFTARDRFRAAAQRLGWTWRAHPIDARGPGGEELTLDVALSAPTGSEPVLVVSSGVHGIEGFFGSAVQIATLEEWHRTGSQPPGLRFVFVHAVSPFGFAHLRRYDEAGIDLNRNFLLPGDAYTGSPWIYAAYEQIINPRRPPSLWDPFLPWTLFAMAWYGFETAKQAVAGGQYEFPRGIFFGGRGPARSHEILLEQFPDWLSDAPGVVHLDIHTGLGKWATYKLLAEDPFPAATAAKVERWFGPGVYEPSEPRGVAYHTRGGFGHWCPHVAGGRDYLFLCAEWGTYPILTVLAGVRAENQAFHWCEPGDPRRQLTKARLKEVFCPASRRWRARTLQQGRQVIAQAVAGLREERNDPIEARAEN